MEEEDEGIMQSQGIHGELLLLRLVLFQSLIVVSDPRHL